MPVTVTFADSFFHYNGPTDTKWSIAGGTIETNLTHVRTGPQSLLISFGNAPRITNLDYPVNTLASSVAQPPRYTVGLAWQTSVLNGDTILELWGLRDPDGAPLGVPLRQFQLTQNADGSLSVYTGNAPTLLGSTAAGIITVGPFWYLELTINMLTNELSLVVTNAANVATLVLALSAFTTTLAYIDALYMVGPVAANAWLADFYFARWDGDEPSLVGAPKIYGAAPIAPDGFGRLNNSPSSTPFNVTSAPYFSQVDEVPQSTADFIAREDVDGFFPFTLGQGFVYDVSAIPDASSISCVQAVHMWSMGHDIDGNAPNPAPFMGFTGGGIPDFSFATEKTPLVDSPFLFITFAFMQNPVSAAPWDLTEFSGGTAFQVGPGVQSSG